MYQVRRIENSPRWSDSDGIKIYTILARNQPVDYAPYLVRLADVKRQKNVAWATTSAFVVFHDGATLPYLVLAWWGNDNELFTSVSVKTTSGWVEDASLYSFCVYDWRCSGMSATTSFSVSIARRQISQIIAKHDSAKDEPLTAKGGMVDAYLK
jgi:hypothetical protein